MLDLPVVLARSGNFGMPPVPQMFQSQQQQRLRAPRMYQQHPANAKCTTLTKHSTVKTTSFRERFLRKAFCRINMAEAPPHRRERVDSIKIDRFYNFILFLCDNLKQTIFCSGCSLTRTSVRAYLQKIRARFQLYDSPPHKLTPCRNLFLSSHTKSCANPFSSPS